MTQVIQDLHTLLGHMFQSAIANMATPSNATAVEAYINSYMGMLVRGSLVGELATEVADVLLSDATGWLLSNHRAAAKLSTGVVPTLGQAGNGDT